MHFFDNPPSEMLKDNNTTPTFITTKAMIDKI